MCDDFDFHLRRPRQSRHLHRRTGRKRLGKIPCINAVHGPKIAQVRHKNRGFYHVGKLQSLVFEQNLYIFQDPFSLRFDRAADDLARERVERNLARTKKKIADTNGVAIWPYRFGRCGRSHSLRFHGQRIASGKRSGKRIRSASHEIGLTHAACSTKYQSGCQSSSGVEQRTHKPLVGGSIPSSGTIFKATPVAAFDRAGTGIPRRRSSGSRDPFRDAAQAVAEVIRSSAQSGRHAYRNRVLNELALTLPNPADEKI